MSAMQAGIMGGQDRGATKERERGGGKTRTRHL
jgi:hypothetical protein